jgi:hypothetical protein
MGFCKWNKLINAKNELELLNVFSESHNELYEVNRDEISAYAENNFSFHSVGKKFMDAYEQALDK